MNDQRTPGLFDATFLPTKTHSGEPLDQLTSVSVNSENSARQFLDGEQGRADSQTNRNGQTPFLSEPAPKTNSDKIKNHPQPDGGMPSGSGTIAQGDPPEPAEDWYAEYAAGEEIPLTDKTAPRWLGKYLDEKKLPVESLTSRGCHLMRFKGRKTIALIIPSVVLGEMNGYQKWYDAQAPWRSVEDRKANPKNRWTVKDPGAAMLNSGLIHSDNSDAPVVLMESPPDAATTDTIIVMGEDLEKPNIHCVVACCGAANLPKAAAILNVEFPGRRLVVIAQSEKTAKRQESLIKYAERAVASHPRASLHVCPHHTEAEKRVGNDLSDMFVRGEIPSWRDLCEAVEPPISDDVDGKSYTDPHSSKAAPIYCPDEDGLEEALAHCHIGLRYNDRAFAIEYRLSDEDRWEPLTDRKEAKIRRILARECLMPAGKDDTAPYRIGSEPKWRNFSNALLADRETDPVFDYILECVETATPFEGPLPNIFTECGYTIDAAIYPVRYQVWVGWLPIHIVVARAISTHAPVQADVMPIHMGAKNIGKTTYAKSHAPPEHPDWIGEGFRWSLNTKERLEATGNAMIVIAGEMVITSKSDRDSIKDWMSFTTPRCRMAYERHSRSHWPRFAMIGNSNEDDPLPNDPGNRRFAPIWLEGEPHKTVAQVASWWADHRDRVFATAYRDVTTGRSLIRADAEMTNILHRLGRRHSYVQEDVASMLHWLEDQRPPKIKARQLASSVLPTAVHDDIARGRYDNQAGQALRLAGYRLDRSSYLRVWRPI